MPRQTRRHFKRNVFWNLHRSSLTVPTVHCRFKSSAFFRPPAVPHFSPWLILSLCVSCHSPLCHSLGPSLFVTSVFDPSPSPSASLPHFLGWLLCSPHIEALRSPSPAPFSLCTAVAGPWMRNNVFCCIRLLIFLIILSCAFVGRDTFFAVKCTVHVRVSVCVSVLYLIIFSLCLSNETCLHLTGFCPSCIGDKCFSVQAVFSRFFRFLPLSPFVSLFLCFSLMHSNFSLPRWHTQQCPFGAPTEIDEDTFWNALLDVYIYWMFLSLKWKT